MSTMEKINMPPVPPYKEVRKDKFERRVTEVTFVPKGRRLFDELATVIKLVDEGGGEFITLYQSTGDNEIRIDPDEWKELRSVIDDMIENCKEDKDFSEGF